MPFSAWFVASIRTFAQRMKSSVDFPFRRSVPSSCQMTASSTWSMSPASTIWRYSTLSASASAQTNASSLS